MSADDACQIGPNGCFAMPVRMAFRRVVASRSFLRDILADVPSQDFVDESLIPHAASTCFLAELLEHPGIDSNRDQLPRYVAKPRPADASHGLQLLRG